MKRFFLGLLAALLFSAPLLAQTITPPQIPTFPGNNVTYTVGSGGTYATITAALAALNTQILPVGGTVTLNVLDGGTTEPGTVYWGTVFGKQISVLPQHAYTTTTTSMQSSSGSAGAYSVILNVGSVTHMATTSDVGITACSGGTLPKLMQGDWAVTNVDAVNTRITVTYTGESASVPSGNVACTVTVLPRIIIASANGFDVWNGQATAEIGGVSIVGNNTAGTAGLSIEDGDRFFVNGLLGVRNFEEGAILLYVSHMNGGELLATGNTDEGLDVEYGSAVDLTSLVSNGNVGSGLTTNRGAALNVCDGGSDCALASNGTYGNSDANKSVVDLGASYVEYNGSGGTVTATNSFVADSSATIANNTTFDNRDYIGYGPVNDNIAFGSGALGSTTTGTKLVGMGTNALHTNSTGAGDIGIGYESGNALTGSFVTGIGAFTNYTLTSGTDVVAIGYEAGYTNSTGGYSVTIGDYSSYHATGSENVGIGYEALYGLSSGGGNTAIGYTAGASVTTGSYNTLIGACAGTTALASTIELCDGQGNVDVTATSTGINSTPIGASTASTGAFSTFSASSATPTFAGLGTDSAQTSRTVCQDTTSKSLYFGSGTAGVCKGTSSARFKHDIRPLGAGLAQILRLDPISYFYNADVGDPTHELYGFTAEQVDPVLPKLVGKDRQGRPSSVDYVGLVPVLTRAVQEQQHQIDALKAEVRRLEHH